VRAAVPVVAFVVPEISVEPLENVIQLALLVAVHMLLAEPESVMLVLVSPAVGAFGSPVGARTGAFSIAMTREPNRTYSFVG
jgi:hypothetical protein